MKGDKNMYKNRVYLTGFLGRDAEVHSARKNGSFTILSLATKRTWRDREAGQLKSETTWHRCIAFGKLAETAASLKTGAYVQIEGEIRNREQTTADGGAKRSTTEIRIISLSRLEHPKESHSGRRAGAARIGRFRLVYRRTHI